MTTQVGIETIKKIKSGELYICDMHDKCGYNKTIRCPHQKPHKYFSACNGPFCHHLRENVKCIKVKNENFITEEEMQI